MKTYIKSLFLASIALLAVNACTGFLETNPSTSVADTEVFKTTQGAQSALYGAYWQMESGNGGANRQDDWGYPTHLMTFDVCGEDMIVWGGWYSYDYNYWGHTRGDIFKASALWRFYYRLINNTNSIINYVDDAEGLQSDKDFIKGQALALRGWAYFHLVRLFQHTYAIAQNMPGVPIYLEPTTDQTEGAPRGTVQDTYDRVLEDFLQAEGLLQGFVRSYKNHIDQSIVRAFLAQTYLTMNNWEKAAEYADKARQGYPLTSNATYLDGFNDVNTPSWMWGIPQTKEQNMGDYSSFAMWANWTRNGFTFQCFFLSNPFVELFDDGDIRKSQFGFTWDVIYTSMKFRDTEDLTGSIVFMRTEEMLLTQAEALARMGKDTQAKELLWQLQEMRGAQKTTATGQDLVEAILIERRKELYGEGLSWFDMIRNQKPLERKGNHVSYGGAKQFPARSWRFVYQIPNSEIVNNKSMESGFWPQGDQNPFDGVYNP
ncbi:MAG: RagB/SusD family nutrient uptake outer membrane protein [Bacteroidales bacterium]|jgi:tetratricopeptide (TPR) repeat protein|nr:RagB/SusD family nutrient uptake outer membrane protein [Bacteroidales bacterium]